GVELVASTKGRAIAEIMQLVEAGVRTIGENRVQEARQKYDSLGGRAALHMIGHLQRNKVRAALPIFAMIHSVDSLRLAEEIECAGRELARTVPVLLEVNVSGEGNKYGISPDDLPSLVERLAGMNAMRVDGLMTMAPLTAGVSGARPVFRTLRTLAESIALMKIPGVCMRHLSMGMSHDFETAIEEGATMVRVGTALFSQ
ncbi:MAG: YggS family pyridoxal phosphate-dependent enzyme, partial [Candidatus Aureabacteria bacterium]|nr:YggS family pyridoxal phosphate-dependent enzyme [Candidatus Auribacterota bacterium]